MEYPLIRNTRLTERDFSEITTNSFHSLQPGDHIFWERTYNIEHHAIVASVDPTSRKLTIIHNNKYALSGTVEYEDIPDVDKKDGKLYRVNYSQADHRRRQALQRAIERIGENSYNLIFNNCEHFATYCATGISESRQIVHVERTIMHPIAEKVKKEINLKSNEKGALFGGIAGGILGYNGSKMFCAKLGITGKSSNCVKFCGTIAGYVAGSHLGLWYPKWGLTACLFLGHLQYWSS